MCISLSLYIYIHMYAILHIMDFRAGVRVSNDARASRAPAAQRLPRFPSPSPPERQPAYSTC